MHKTKLLDESMEVKRRLKSGHIPLICSKWFTQVPACMRKRESEGTKETKGARESWMREFHSQSVCMCSRFSDHSSALWARTWEVVSGCVRATMPNLRIPCSQGLRHWPEWLICYVCFILQRCCFEKLHKPNEEIQVGLEEGSSHQFSVSKPDLSSTPWDQFQWFNPKGTRCQTRS